MHNKTLLLKRLFDLVFSIAGIVILSPLMLIIALAIKIRIGSPIVYSQLRPGFKGKIFKIYKYRTMTNDRDENGKLLSSKSRLTSFGSILRKTSLDELPELWNVIKGDMSLVGPRPLRIEYIEHYTKEQMKRHDVLPGVTGWAQINGRNNLDWEDKFRLDVWYVENATFMLDIKILFMTINKVLQRKDINDTDDTLVKPFMGAKLDG